MQTDLTTLRAFLAYFPQAQKSHVANLFLAPVRRGIATPDAVRAAVYADLRERVERCRRFGWDCARDEGILAQMARCYDESLDFARWALAYERLSPDEKRRQKDQRGGEAIMARMDHEPPTERQVAYLRRAGYTGPIDSKRFASSLIDIYTRGGRVEMGGAA